MSLYSIWILEYAYILKNPITPLMNGEFGRDVKLPYSYTLLKGRDVNVLIDVGFDPNHDSRKYGDRFGVENWRSPEVVLAEVGLKPEDITHVILTHAHFDHMGGLALFPNAVFYIQDVELTQWVWSLTLDRKFRWLPGGVDPEHIMQAIALAREGRFKTVSGDVENVLPGIDVCLAKDTHTPGSQFAVVRNDGLSESQDRYICPGDLVYLHENLHGGDPNDPFYHPVGVAWGSPVNLLYASDRMMELAGELPRILVAHEERMSTFYPSRKTKAGLTVIEVALANGESSKVDQTRHSELTEADAF